MVKCIKYGILIMNDSVNSFQYVINMLQDLFSWDITQASNCANIIHNKGEYVVKWLDSEDAAVFVIKILKSKGMKAKLVVDKNATI